MVASRNCVPLPKLPSGATLNLESPGWGANSREWGGKLSTGGRVWPGAAAMCQLLLTLQPDVKNSHVLELGCGTGAAGLFAAALGAQRVLLTDGQAPETQLAALNARRHAELLAAGARVDARQYRWGHSVRELLEVSGGFDFVLGADILYSDETLPPLCDTIRDLRESGGVGGGAPRVLLAHQTDRHGESDIPKLLGLVAAGRGLELQPYDGDVDVAPNVALYELAYT